MEYLEFSVTAGVEKTRYDCRFRTLISAIAPRHSDTMDVSFLVNGKPVVVALPLVAFSDYRKRAGEPLTDEEIIQIAALFLRETLEKQELGEDRMAVASPDPVLALAEQVRPINV